MGENTLESLYHHPTSNPTTTAAMEDIFGAVLRLLLKSLFLKLRVKVIADI